MSEERIYGVLEINGKQYQYTLEDQFLTIPNISYQDEEEFEKNDQIDIIYGTTSNYQGIVFLDCKVLEGIGSIFSSEVKIRVLGYIVLTRGICSFDRIDFYSEAINGFFSPRNAYDLETKDDGRTLMGIKFRDSDLYKREYACQVNNEQFLIGLNVYLTVNLALEKEQLGTAKTIISMSFEQKKDPHDVLDYYLYLRDFLVFVNGQQNIPLDRIELFEKNESGRYEKQGRVVIFQADSSGYVPNPYKSITFNDITSDCYPVLFGQIAEKRKQNYYYHLFYPTDHKNHQRIDASKWLNTAICFESEFNNSFPNFRAKQDAAFHNAKSLLLQTIDEAVKKSGKSINNKQNSALKSFLSLIDHSDTTIKQKFQVCEDQFMYEMGEAIQRICSACMIPRDTDLAEVYSAYRNKTAHGVISRPEACDVATYRIMRGFICVMNLKRANVPQERIKSIVNKLV